MNAKFWLENLKGGNHLENLDFGGKIILKWILGKSGLGVWIRLMWLKSGAGGGLL
jgi:hypothetical protein